MGRRVQIAPLAKEFFFLVGPFYRGVSCGAPELRKFSF